LAEGYQMRSYHFLNDVRKSFIQQILSIINSSVTKNFCIYFAGALLLRSISLFSAPITMNILNPHDYGLLALVNSFISIAVVFAGLGLRQALSLEFFHLDEDNRKILINDIVGIYLLISTPLLIGAFVCMPFINRSLFLNAAPSVLIAISFIICFIYFFVELFYQLLQYHCKAAALTTLQTTVALITLISQILFLWHLRLGIYSIIGAQLIGMLISFVVALYMYYQQSCNSSFSLSRSFNTVWHYIKLGLPFIPSVLFGWILASSNRFVLAHYTTLHDVGIYALADTFGQLFHMVILYPLSGSYLPTLLTRFSQNKNSLISIEQNNQSIMRKSMVCAAVIIIGGFFLFRPLLFWVLPYAYQEAINYILITLLSYVFLLGQYFVSAFIQFHKKSWFLAFSLLIPSGINLALNSILIPYCTARCCCAIYGVVISSFISYAIYFLITLTYNHYLQRAYRNNDLSYQ
jgi:O-antigen/teichoic acid export membrane protein